MQLKRKKNMGRLAAVLLFTGCFMLTTGKAILAQENKVQLDFTKIRQALKKEGMASGGAAATVPSMSTGQMSATTAGSPVKSTQASSAVIGTMDQEMAQVMEETMQNTSISSDIMAEMQKRLWLRIWGPFRRPSKPR